MERFYQPLGKGTFAYRPIAFATYGLDWLAYRGNAAGWRITSLLLYSINAVVAGTLVSRWLKGRSSQAALAGVVGGCTLFAYPFAGEISFWLAGRFDLLAALRASAPESRGDSIAQCHDRTDLYESPGLSGAIVRLSRS